MKILGWVHHMRLSCGCTLLDWQTPDGMSGCLRRKVEDEWRSLTFFEIMKVRPPGARFDGRIFAYCPTCQAEWKDRLDPVTVFQDHVHVMTDQDTLPEGTYLGGLCCASRTCPEGWYGRRGEAEQKVEQLELFGDWAGAGVV